MVANIVKVRSNQKFGGQAILSERITSKSSEEKRTLVAGVRLIGFVRLLCATNSTSLAPTNDATNKGAGRAREKGEEEKAGEEVEELKEEGNKKQ